MVNVPYGEADRSTGGRLEMVNVMADGYLESHYAEYEKKKAEWLKKKSKWSYGKSQNNQMTK